MAGSELGESSPRPRGLSRLRRDDKAPANASTHSLASTSSKDPAEPSDGVGLRGSMDNALDRVMAKARRSSDDRRGSNDSGNAGGRRLSALVGRRRRSKRKDESTASRPTSTRSGESAGDLPGVVGGNLNRSEVSLAGDGSGNSSLLTDGYSDDERSKPTRPTISPHHSHLGYLTLSSPQLNANATTASDLTQPDAIHSVAASSSAIDVPSIVEPSTTDSLEPDSTNRESSPGAKLKSAFTINRKKSGDSDSVKSGAGGGSAGGLGALFKPRSRRSSVNAQEQAEGETESPAATASAPVRPDSQQSEARPSTPLKARGRNRVNTNPTLPSTPPNIPDTPTTLVTPPTPTDPSHTIPKLPSPAKQSPSRPLSSVESIRHRRAQSQIIPSKLSSATAAPLTPTLEEAKTPGGTLTQPTSASGFFTSVFSAAQKAADQLSNSINTPAVLNQKNKAAPASQTPVEAGGEEVIPGVESQSEGGEAKRQPAVETLGKGDLSLSHLGIAENKEASPMNSTTDLPRQDGQANNSQANKAEEEAAARAVSVAYEKPASVVSQAMGGRPLSVASQDRLTLTGDQTPPRPIGDQDGIKRSGSVRSKLSGRRRRHRASSATTTTTNTNTIAAALRDSASGVAQATTSGPGHRLTGFAVASSKRNKDFHQLFRSVPEDDYLIEDYSAALQRDILLHGRLYVSEGHLCFSSNIFGWVTNLVISFDEVVSVEKKNTAVVFPNAIVIATLQARNTFASLVARDSTYDLLIGIWKISHPNLKSSLNGVTLSNADTGDKTEKASLASSDDEASPASATDDEVYDEDADASDLGSLTEADASRSVAGSDFADAPLSRKTSAQPLPTSSSAPAPASTSPKGHEGADAHLAGAIATQDFPGPAAHAPTDCGCVSEHYDRPLTDTVIPAPLGKVYTLMYGPASGAFMNKWLVDDQKSRDLEYADDKVGIDNEHKSFVFSYIKPLSNSVGPKQTKCITTNTLEQFDLERVVSVSCSTQTPDAPSGNVFTTKTRYCLMWAPGNQTRMVANCTVEWTGKSWLKGPIEGGAQNGQVQYVKDIVAALKAAVATTKPSASGGKGARKGKRRNKTAAPDSDGVVDKPQSSPAANQEANWGLLEPVRPLLEPVVSVLKPFGSSQVVIAVLVSLLLYSWFFPTGPAASGVGRYGSPDRIAAYEELWRREESELWDWLEERVGAASGSGGEKGGKLGGGGLGEKQKVLMEREMGKRVQAEGMREREVEEAVRVTGERLEALRGALGRGKD